MQLPPATGYGHYGGHNFAPDPAAAYARTAWRVRRISQIVYLILGIREVLLLFRFGLKLLAADPNAAFSSFIYSITDPFVAPFEGVFPTPHSRGSILDLAAVLAMLVYALLAWGIVKVIIVVSQRRSPAVS